MGHPGLPEATLAEQIRALSAQVSPLNSDNATYEVRVSTSTETTCVRTLDRQYIECLQHGGTWLDLCDSSFNAHSE